MRAPPRALASRAAWTSWKEDNLLGCPSYVRLLNEGPLEAPKGHVLQREVFSESQRCLKRVKETLYNLCWNFLLENQFGKPQACLLCFISFEYFIHVTLLSSSRRLSPACPPPLKSPYFSLQVCFCFPFLHLPLPFKNVLLISS